MKINFGLRVRKYHPQYCNPVIFLPGSVRCSSALCLFIKQIIQLTKLLSSEILIQSLPDTLPLGKHTMQTLVSNCSNSMCGNSCTTCRRLYRLDHSCVHFNQTCGSWLLVIGHYQRKFSFFISMINGVTCMSHILQWKSRHDVKVS